MSHYDDNYSVADTAYWKRYEATVAEFKSKLSVVCDAIGGNTRQVVMLNLELADADKVEQRVKVLNRWIKELDIEESNID